MELRSTTARRHSLSRSPQSSPRNRNNYSESSDLSDEELINPPPAPGFVHHSPQSRRRLSRDNRDNIGWKIPTEIPRSNLGCKDTSRGYLNDSTTDLHSTTAESFNLSNESKKSTPRQYKNKSNDFIPKTGENSLSNPWPFIILSSFLAVASIYFSMTAFTSFFSTPSTAHNCSSLLDLSESYPGMDKLFWRTLTVGAEHVRKGDPPQPTVFFIVHHDKRAAKSFTHDLAHHLKRCLNSEKEPLYLTDRDFNSAKFINDYGLAIAEYKDKLAEAKVMVVQDIQNVDGNVVEAFHTICDKYTPMVPKSVIIFAYFSPTTEKMGNLYDFVEMKLTDLWSRAKAIRKNKMQALIVRMTENVLHLKIQENK